MSEAGGGERMARAVEGYASVVNLALRGGDWHEGLDETPHRAAKAMIEMTGGYDVDIASLFKTFPSEGYDEIVVVSGIPFVSLCEHHLLPFIGRASIAYLPGDRIVGLSKLARLVEAYARRLQVQERMTRQIADALDEHLTPKGTGVVVEAEHMCMACRGVRTHGVAAVTSSMRGVMRDNPETRAEVLALLTTGG